MTTGVVVGLASGDRLELDGLDRLDDDLYIRVLEVARARKAEIVGELKERALASSGQPAANPKPCATLSGLPCLGAAGTCFGKVYWLGKPFKGESERVKAEKLLTCPYNEAVQRFLALHGVVKNDMLSRTPGTKASP